jgi:predicted HicB family RNase H-like nuclease
MTAPIETKTVRVSEETHRRIMAIARDLRGTADEALTMLLNEDMVHVPLTHVQHQRWKTAANERGVSVRQLISLCVEAAVTGGDSTLIERTYYLVRAIVSHHGISPTAGLQLSTDAPTEGTTT